jgi:MoaA/NifB/PqqE/SkfB family radical SAM enzyme
VHSPRHTARAAPRPTRFEQGTRALRSALSCRLAVRSGFRITPRPFILVWEATHRCNSRCAYCNVRLPAAAPAADLGTAEICTIIDDAARLGLYCLVLSGGEPLLRDDLPEIIDHAHARGLFVSMTTNGTGIDAALATVRRCDHVTISIDATSAPEYRRRRGIDAFDDVVANLRRLAVEPGRRTVHVQAVLDARNWRDLLRLNRFFHPLGTDTVFQLVYDQPFAIDAASWEAMVRELRFHSSALGLLQRRFLRLFPAIAAGRARSPCLALTTNLVVSPAGELLACNYRRSPLADLRHEPLGQAWTALEHERRDLARQRTCRCANTCFTMPAMVLS